MQTFQIPDQDPAGSAMIMTCSADREISAPYDEETSDRAKVSELRIKYDVAALTLCNMYQLLTKMCFFLSDSKHELQ